MVKTITNLTRSGVSDWLLQRVTAIILAAFTLFLLDFFLTHSQVHYADWHLLFSTVWFRVLSFLVILSLLSHAWIGIWTVTTDYVNPTWLRLLVQIAIILGIFACLIWSVTILWG